MRPLGVNTEGFALAVKGCLQFLVIDDLETGFAKKLQPLRYRQVELNTARVDFHLSPVLLVQAEIGLMNATSQIDAMELMAIDPIKRIALPRFLAGVISVPLLTAMFNALAIMGAVVFSIGVMGLDPGIFWGKLQTSIYFDKDFMGGVYKSLVFGGLVSLVAVYFGYYAKPTGAGVGTATTNTVVLSSVLILVFDFIMTSFFV